MTDQEIKVGSLVMLNSGSPTMTVTYLGEGTDGKKGACCVFWNDAKSRFIKVEVTSVEMLKQVA